MALVLCHLNKATAVNSRHRVMGGAAWVNAPRLVLLVGTPQGTDARETGDRLLAVEKSNLGVYPAAVSFALVSAREDRSRAVVRIGGEVEGVRPADLVCSLDGDDSARSALEEAMDFLREELGADPTGVRDLKRAAEAAGIAWRTVERAKRRLGVETVRVSDGNRGDGQWMWHIPADPSRKAAHLEGNGAGDEPRRSCQSADDDRAFADDAAARLPTCGGGSLATKDGSTLSEDEVIRRLLDAFPGSYEERSPHATSSSSVPKTQLDPANWRNLLPNGARR